MLRPLLLILLLVPLQASAGDGPRWQPGARLHGGFLAAHHESLWIMVDRLAWAAELHVERPFSGRKEWHGTYGVARWGIGAMWLDAGSDMLGPAFRVLPYLALPVLPGERWQLEARVGWGLGVVRGPFDRVENFKQHAVGSRLNLAVQLAACMRRSWGLHALEAGLALDHLSNGAMQRPNLGINVITLHTGYTHRFGGPAFRSAVRDSSWHGERLIIFAMANMGWNEAFPVGSGRRPVLSLSASAYRRLSPKSAVGFGLDLFHKGSLRISAPELADSPAAGLLQAGVHVGYNMLLGGMALQFETGTYLHTPVPERAAIYTRVGMRQQLTHRLFANLSLKSHFFVADHFEIGLGYRFR